jgi:hypothetical protein
MVSLRAFISFVFLCVLANAYSQFDSTGTSARWNPVATGTNSRETRTMIATVGDASTLRNYWVDILGQQTPVPKVDYFKERVVIVFVGKRNTGGYTLNVTDVRGMPGGRTIVYVDEATPAPGMATTQTLTSPWALITVARESVSFEMSVRQVQSIPPPVFGGGFGGWVPCWQPYCGGYGGEWNDPCGFLFDNGSQFGAWSNQFQISVNGGFGYINYNQSVFAVLTLGDLGIGYQGEVREVTIRRSEATVYLSRERMKTVYDPQAPRPWVGITLPKAVRSVNVRVMDGGQMTGVASGVGLVPRGRTLSQVISSERDMERLTGGQMVAELQTLSNFDYRTNELGLVSIPHVEVARDIRLEGVTYDKGIATVLYSRVSVTKTLPAPKNDSIWVGVRLKKGTRAVQVAQIRSASPQR